MAETNHFPPIARANLTEEIIKRILNVITDIEMKPGDKLPTERELVTRFAVGRSSIREAIKILYAIEVVRIVPGAGMFVGNGNLSLLAKPFSGAAEVRRAAPDRPAETDEGGGRAGVAAFEHR